MDIELEVIEKRIKKLRTYSKRVINYSTVLTTFIFLLILVSFMILVGNISNYTQKIFIIQMSLLLVIVLSCIFFYYSKISQGEYANYIAQQYSIEARKLETSLNSEKFDEDTITLYDFVEIEVTPYRDVLNNEYDKLSSNLFFPKN